MPVSDLDRKPQQCLPTRPTVDSVPALLLSTADLHVSHLQSSLTTRAANDGGRTTMAYEGATFSSDDPDYKGQGGGLTHPRGSFYLLCQEATEKACRLSGYCCRLQDSLGKIVTSGSPGIKKTRPRGVTCHDCCADCRARLPLGCDARWWFVNTPCSKGRRQ